MITAIRTYLTEAVQELELVRWPTRQQAVRLSVIVTAFTVISAALFGVIDFALSEALRFALSLAS